jgi:hypothetical protein
MGDEELKYPKWQAPVQDLILEFDREKLSEKVRRVESLISDRLQQLRQEGNGGGELQAIDDALRTLRIIKRDTLDRPHRTETDRD